MHCQHEAIGKDGHRRVGGYVRSRPCYFHLCTKVKTKGLARKLCDDAVSERAMCHRGETEEGEWLNGHRGTEQRGVLLSRASRRCLSLGCTGKNVMSRKMCSCLMSVNLVGSSRHERGDVA